MAGTIYKRCVGCGRKVAKRTCTNPDCDGDRYSWAFSTLLGRRADGSPRQVLRSGFDTKREAEAALEEARSNSATGYVAPRKLSLESYLLERWLPRTRTSEKTRRDREVHAKAYVIPRLGGIRLIDVTGAMLTEMYDDLAVNGRTTKPDPDLGWGLSPTTIRRIHVLLNKAFNDAVRWGLLQRNPCRRADPPSTTEVKARAFAARTIYTWDQLRTMLDAARQDRLHALWHLLVSTGMRRCEVAALRWDHVDLDNMMLSVVRCAVESAGEVHERDLPKSSSSRRAIELDPRDVDVLRKHRAQQDQERASVGASWNDTDHVFTSPVGARLYPPDITRWFHQLTDQAGLPRIRVHDLRHTNATHLIKAGVPVKVVTERLGHSTTAYTQDAYQHVMPGMQREAAATFHDQLSSDEEPRNDGTEEYPS